MKAKKIIMTDNQTSEIMRSLGRIEQKADGTITSLNTFKEELKGILKDHAVRIEGLELSRATTEGKTKTLTMIWSGIVSFSVAVIAAYISRK